VRHRPSATTSTSTAPTSEQTEYDAVVVGAGFAGMYMLHRLRGLGLSAVVFEAASDVGGTWWWNRYPGARCDIESMDYSYSFDPDLEQEWEWTERYATQPEILRYANHVADRYDLRRDIRFDTRVTGAEWDDGTWTVTAGGGDRITARFCVMATGCLSTTKQPEVAGIDRFDGPTYHTGRWPHDGVDFTGMRVGVIGTGSSGIQSIPLIAEQAEHLTVFQRTPNFSMPANNAPLDPGFISERKRNYRRHRLEATQSRAGVPVAVIDEPALSVDEGERERRYRVGWEQGTLFGMASKFNDILLDRDANETAAEFIRRRIGEVVDDPEVAELLMPRDYPFGTKRPCLDTNYYATFNRDNVSLVDVRATPIVEITTGGLRTTGDEYELDAIVFATGFDAMTGPLLGPDIRGVDGLALRDHWAAGPRTYLGISVAGFPNLFTITGPGSPSVLTNMMVSIEQHVDWVADCIGYLDREGLGAIAATSEAEQGWVDHVEEVGNFTLYPLADSWYMGANVPGKPRVFMPYIGGADVYRQICDGVAADGYKGFELLPG
jgi:cation diffusion facilitator CzcD-associated flavoprotein CzcO